MNMHSYCLSSFVSSVLDTVVLTRLDACKRSASDNPLNYRFNKKKVLCKVFFVVVEVVIQYSTCPPVTVADVRRQRCTVVHVALARRQMLHQIGPDVFFTFFIPWQLSENFIGTFLLFSLMDNEDNAQYAATGFVDQYVGHRYRFESSGEKPSLLPFHLRGTEDVVLPISCLAVQQDIKARLLTVDSVAWSFYDDALTTDAVMNYMEDYY
ncbi:hypothetical protein F2P81_016267 [Scophthalmus maximus]|uniref:Uncharacterized protein n=1 Tax=Scophthalmus maximus TaxID=52904 RepID=A0A6A4SN48_SCOMX|nr:hypothetical protein F2P81_016267 [Scophthalmus maximus]